MSLKTTIRLPECFSKLPECVSKSFIGLVGISSLDNYVYIWQTIKKEESREILIIYQVNPLVPRSWLVFKEITLDNSFYFLHASFNATCSKMALRYRCFHKVKKDELLLVDMTSDQTETRLIQNFAGGADIFCDFAETAVGWVAVVKKDGKIYCCKMFPELVENQILLEPSILDYEDGIGLTYDSFMHIELSKGFYKVVSYDFLSGNSAEMGVAQWNLDVPHPFLIAVFDKSYLIRPSEDLSHRVYQVQQDHLGINLRYLNQLDDQSLPWYDCVNFWKAGNDKFAVIHPRYGNPKFLSVAHLGVPSLKSLTVWAVQKRYGTIGDDGALVDGISEEELKKSIGYQKNKKLF